MFNKKLIVLLSLPFLIFGCSSKNDVLNTSSSFEKEGYRSLIADRCFKNGFVFSKSDNVPNDYYYKDLYQPFDKGTPSWKYIQWMTEFPINPGDSSSYYDYIEGSKCFICSKPNKTRYSHSLTVDSNTGDFTMTVDARNEYSDCSMRPYSTGYGGQWWVHSLLEQDFSGDNLIYIFDKEEIWIDIEYKITRDILIHGFYENTTELQFFITVQNRNKKVEYSETKISDEEIKTNYPDYGDYFWFGLHLYGLGVHNEDYYSDEYGSGVFIYKMLGDKVFVDSDTLPRAGESRHVLFNCKPYIKDILDRFDGCVEYDDLGDLAFGSMNIGYEVFGCNRVDTTFTKFNIYYK